jgi:hypothetical protein
VCAPAAPHAQAQGNADRPPTRAAIPFRERRIALGRSRDRRVKRVAQSSATGPDAYNKGERSPREAPSRRRHSHPNRDGFVREPRVAVSVDTDTHRRLAVKHPKQSHRRFTNVRLAITCKNRTINGRMLDTITPGPPSSKLGSRCGW